MAITITSDAKPPTVEIIFYVKEGDNSPYQGRLVYTQDEYAALTPDDIAAAQTAQFEAWKAATLAAQQAAELASATVPAQITAVQARKAVLAAGLRSTVEAAVAQADEATQDLWYTAEHIERDNPVLNALAAQLWGANADAMLDQLFLAAQGL